MPRKTKKMSQYNAPVVSEEEYEVECVRDSRIINGVEQFLIKWAGYDENSCTWEPRSNLNCEQKLQDYFDRKNKTFGQHQEAAKDSKKTVEAGQKQKDLEEPRLTNHTSNTGHTSQEHYRKLTASQKNKQSQSAQSNSVNQTKLKDAPTTTHSAKPQRPPVKPSEHLLANQKKNESAKQIQNPAKTIFDKPPKTSNILHTPPVLVKDEFETGMRGLNKQSGRPVKSAHAKNRSKDDIGPQNSYVGPIRTKTLMSFPQTPYARPDASKKDVQPSSWMSSSASYVPSASATSLPSPTDTSPSSITSDRDKVEKLMAIKPKKKKPDQLNSQPMIPRSLTPTAPKEWKGLLYKTKNDRLVGTISIKPLSERCDEILMHELRDEERLTLDNIVVQSFVFHLYKQFPQALYTMHSSLPQYQLEQTVLPLKFSEMVGVIWLPRVAPQNVLFAIPTSTRACEVLRVARPNELFILFRFSLAHAPPRPQISAFQSKSGYSLVRPEELKDPDRFDAELTAQLLGNIPSEFVAALFNKVFTIIAPDECHYEVRDMRLFLCTMRGTYKQFKETDLFDVDVIFIHRAMMKNCDTLPDITAVKRKKNVKFFLFGHYLSDGPNPGLPCEIYTSGGLVTITSQALFDDTVDIISKLVEFSRAQKLSRPSVVWKISIHKDTINYLANVKDDPLHPEQNRAQDVMQAISLKLTHQQIDVIETVCPQKGDDLTIDEVLYLYMQQLHLSHYSEYRYFIVIDVKKDIKLRIPGVESLTYQEFRHRFILDNQ